MSVCTIAADVKIIVHILRTSKKYLTVKIKNVHRVAFAYNAFNSYFGAKVQFLVRIKFNNA